jgi:hypothetical protein
MLPQRVSHALAKEGAARGLAAGGVRGIASSIDVEAFSLIELRASSASFVKINKLCRAYWY